MVGIHPSIESDCCRREGGFVVYGERDGWMGRDEFDDDDDAVRMGWTLTDEG